MLRVRREREGGKEKRKEELLSPATPPVLVDPELNGATFHCRQAAEGRAPGGATGWEERKKERKKKKKEGGGEKPASVLISPPLSVSMITTKGGGRGKKGRGLSWSFRLNRRRLSASAQHFRSSTPPERKGGRGKKGREGERGERKGKGSPASVSLIGRLRPVSLSSGAT